MTDTTRGRDVDLTATVTGMHRVLATGTVVAARYRIIRLVGVGAMGMVYRAQDERLNVEVALKVLRPQQGQDTHALERFEQELVLARQVTHKNVVRIHDIGQDGDLHFLTMDHVEGRSLKQILEEQGKLEVGEAVSVARDLAAALGAAHAKSVVHRDLKPANVLVDNQWRAYITDFGVARSLHQSGLTQTGGIVGTLEYLAPEQARGEAVDGRADLYALGLILFEMLTGKRPFRGESAEEILAARSAGKPQRLLDTDASQPQWLSQVVERCLASDPAARYATAAKLDHDLGAARVGKRQLAKLPRNMLLWGGVGAGALAIAGLVWWFYTTGRELLPDRATRSVAVMPLDVQAGKSSAWMSSGFAEMLAQGLAESADLQVADSLRVRRTLEDLHIAPERVGGRDLARLGELLDVELLVTGTVREAGGQVQVELKLVDLDAPEREVKPIQGEAAAPEIFKLSGQLAAKLRQSLAASPVQQPAASSLSANGAAMTAYESGLNQLVKGDTTAAEKAFGEAVQKDARFTSAWVQLAMAQAQLGFDDRALESARQAVATLGQQSGRIGYEARALVATLSGDYGQAQKLLIALISQYPHDVEARVELAEAYGEQGELDRAQRELRKIVDASPNHPRAWYLLGKYAILAGDNAAAADDYLVHALVIQNRLGNVQGRADAENAMGIALAEVGRLDEARQHYGSAIDLRTQIGDARGVAAATANIARIALRRGQFDEARAGLAKALEIVEGIGNRETAANLQNEIGGLEERQGNYREALARYRQSLAILGDLGDQRALAESYNNVGFAYYQLGDFDNAAVYAQQSMQLYQKTANREGQMYAGQTLGMLALARGEWDRAEKSWLQVLDFAREFKDPLTEGIALGQLARTAQYQGNYGAAQASLKEGLAALERSGDARAITELTLFEADLALELGMLDEGRKALMEVHPKLDAASSLEHRAEWARLQAVAQLRAGQVEEARRGFEEARRQAGASGSAIGRLAIELGSANVRIAAGEGPVAVQALTRLLSDARALGHQPLVLQCSEMLALAEQRAGQNRQAENQLRATLRIADAHSPWSGRYRLESRLAEVLDRLGRVADAERERRAARAEVERVRQGLDPAQKASFEKLEEVRKLGQPARNAPAA